MKYSLNDAEEFKDLNKYKHWYKTEADHFIIDRKKEFSSQIKTIEDLVDKYFTSIYPILKLIIDHK